MNAQQLRWILAVAALVFLTGISHAQPDFSGYYENTTQIDQPEKGDETLVSASKVRLDVQSGGEDGELGFRGNVNFLYYHSDLAINAEPYLPPDIVRVMRQFGQQPVVNLDRSRIYLDNAFLTWNTHGFTLRAGKQQLSWGPGYSINPTDLFHKKSLIDPTYEKEGVGAIRLDYRWGIGGQIAAIMAPGPNFDQSGYALRLATYLSAIGYDVAVTAHSVTDSTSLDPTFLMPRTQRREALGLEFTGSLLGLGIWMEGNYNWMESEDDFARVVGGFDYTFENGLYVMAEGFYNGRAEEETPYPISDWLANLLYGEPVGPGWLMLGTRYDITMLTTASLYAFVSPDETYMINPRLTISIAQNADATLFAGYTLGEEDGAFPSGLLSGFARLNVYF